MATLEVVVSLTPLSNPGEFTRSIELSSATNKVYVGRASKNQVKGLLADKHNAWFDSPIMSRHHAILSMSSLPKRILLEDCGSTHGTYVSGERLQPQEPRPLNPWDIITFGTKVTSGADIYPAREFSVGFEWKTPIIGDASGPLKPQTSTGFQVPEEEEEEEEQDSSSEVSITDSLQILSSHPRTYSVPSSNDSNDGSVDENSEIPDTYASKSSVSLTREISDISKLETQQSKAQQVTASISTISDQPNAEETKSVGASEANPIHLEDAQSRRDCIDIASDSDDDGPETLPVPTNSIQARLTSQRPDSAFGRRTPHGSAQDPETLFHEETLSHQQSNNQSQEPLPADKFTGWESDDVDEMDDIDDVDDMGDMDSEISENDFDGNESPIRSRNQPSSTLGPVSGRHVTFKLSENFGEEPSTQHPATDTYMSRNLSGSDRASHSVMQSGSAFLERAPSPSDAALAKKASITEVSWDRDMPITSANSVRSAADQRVVPSSTGSSRTQDRTENQDKRGKLEQEHDQRITQEVLDRIAQEKEVHQAKIYEELREDELRRKDEWLRMDQQKVADQDGESHKRNGELKNGANDYSCFEPASASRGIDSWEDPFPELVEKPSYEHSKSYRVGPFSTHVGSDNAFDSTYYHPYVPSSTVHQHINGHVNAHKDENVQPTDGLYPSYGTSNVFETYPSAPWYTRSGVEKRPCYTPFPTQPFTPDAPSLPNPTRLQNIITPKPDEPRAPRVPIADLLTPPNGPKAIPKPQHTLLTPPSATKSLKRKADEMEVEEEHVQDSFGGESLLTPESQRSVLPDAQPRDEPATPSKTTITNTSQDTFVLEGKGSSQSQLNALAARETAGPARKKARTLSSRTGGFAKFISGVAVGVAGVVAAFVATIPDSVREEAMREVSKSIQ